MKKLLFTFFLGITILSAKAQTNYIWTGASNANWGSAANWNPSSVPTANDNVTIGNIATPIVVTSSISVRQLTTTAGAKIDLQNDANFEH